MIPRWLWVVLGEIVVVGTTAASALLSHPTQFSFALPTALVASATLPLRLRWPWLALLCCLPALVGGLGWPAAIVALYRIGRVTRPVRIVVAWVGVGLLAMQLPLQLKVIMPWQDRVMSVAFSVVGLFGPAAFGALVRVRRELTLSLRQLQRAREAALRLRGLAKDSLAEMRAALGLLNEEPTPQGLADLPTLLTKVCRAGLRIEFDGDVTESDTTPLVGRAIYRIVQEALTNVTKHAPASAVRVKLVRDRTQVLVSVVNGTPARLPAPLDVGGTGLEGLAERVRTAGGTLRAEALPDGGFSVLAELPLDGPANSTKVGSAHSTSGGTQGSVAEP